MAIAYRKKNTGYDFWSIFVSKNDILYFYNDDQTIQQCYTIWISQIRKSCFTWYFLMNDSQMEYSFIWYFCFESIQYYKLQKSLKTKNIVSCNKKCVKNDIRYFCDLWPPNCWWFYLLLLTHEHFIKPRAEKV